MVLQEATEQPHGVYRHKVATLIALWLMAAGHCVGIGIGGTTAVRNRSVFAWSILVTQPAHCCRSRPPQDAAVRPVIAAIRAERSILLADTLAY